MSKRNAKRVHRHKRVRAKISGTQERPRVSVYRSLNHLYAQIIDDTTDKTLIGLSDKAVSGKMTKTEKAAKLGEELGKKAKDAKIETVVFDRGGHAYLGRVKAFAEGLRKAGLEF
jgi:large subunit ribosomal protein L18